MSLPTATPTSPPAPPGRQRMGASVLGALKRRVRQVLPQGLRRPWVQPVAAAEDETTMHSPCL